MKPYLLIAGDNYYPSAYTGDWVRTFSTRQEAEDAVRKTEHHKYFQRGPRKGQVKETHEEYRVNHPKYGDCKIDWYEIVDLREWISGNEE